jgi:hypothetical protein
MSIVDFCLLQQREAQQKEACQHGTTLPLCHPIQSRLFCSFAGELSSVNSDELRCVCVAVTSLLRGSFWVNVLKLSVAGYLRRFVCSATWCSLRQVTV